MSSETYKPIKWDVSPAQVGITKFVAAELESAGYELISKEEVESACVWLWLHRDGRKWFVALRTGGAGRGRGKVVLTALVYSQEHLLEVVEKFQKFSLVVA